MLRIVVIFLSPFKILQILCPTDILIDYIAWNLTLTEFGSHLQCLRFFRVKTTTLREAKRPLRRHNRFPCQGDILTQDILIIFPENKVIDKCSVWCLKRIIFIGLCTKFEFCFISIIKENPILVTTHKEGYTFI